MQTIAAFALLCASATMANTVGMEVEGIENCPNKCDKVFERNQYAIADQPNTDTFEYRSCVLGCNQCSSELDNLANIQNDNCFEYCKTLDYTSLNIRKGLIEPDKACIIGCIINTCQEVCVGGTTDDTVTPANQNLWWGQGGKGCSIKSGGGYVQNPDYGNPDSPGGQGADDSIKQCCTNAFNACEYTGPTNTVNYANVVKVTQKACKKQVPSKNLAKICEFYNSGQYCGKPGMGPA